ncbi:hypothetical protein V5O48_004562 [Marasmius crinis-equi]|uniref:F-box domain-containing protein n=1 Tax=Marasmius crinis-equi TaxID=585013 RepID=A0ABR3FPR4_9AGAR
MDEPSTESVDTRSFFERFRAEITAHAQRRVDTPNTTGRSSQGTCSPTSALYSVPVEIWGIIFSIICHPYSFRIHHTSDEGDLVVDAPPIVLSQVASYWRRVARSIPRLWSSISVDLKDLPLDISTPLGLCITHSQNYPLDIRIAREPSSPLVYSELDNTAWQTLAAHFPRCKNLSLASPLIDWPETPDVRFSNLESFYEEEYIYMTDQHGYRLFRKALYDAPKLTRATVWDLRSSRLPLTRLTSVNLLSLNSKGMIRLVRYLLSYETLESLSIGGFDTSLTQSTVATESLGNVEAPRSLRHLRIYDEKNDPCDRWPWAVYTLAEHSPLLERVNLTMSLRGWDMYGINLIRFLESLPNVKRLEVDLGLPVAVDTSDQTSQRDELDIDLPPHQTLPLFASFARARGGDEIALGVITELVTTSGYQEITPFLPKLEFLSMKLPSTGDMTLREEVVKKILEGISIERGYRSENPRPWVGFRLELAQSGGVFDAVSERVLELEGERGIRVVIEDDSAS